MKKLISLLLCMLLTGCAATYDGPTQEIPRLTEYTVDHYYAFFDWEETHYTNRTVYAYDIYGNRVREMAYRDGEPDYVRYLRYDDRGNCIREVTWDHSGWIPLFDSRVDQTYDDQNRVLSYTEYDFFGRRLGGSTYTYDDEAHLQIWSNGEGDTCTIHLDESGRMLREVSDTTETVFEYDAQGNRTGWASYENGVLSSRYEVRFDDQNRQIWGGHYDAAGNLTHQYEYLYDDEAHTKVYTKGDGGKRVEHYHPDGRMHMIEDFDAEGHLSMLQRYTYQNIRVPAKEE